jgi:hypothetical protein
MIDWFVILTPILLLAVVALLAFVGCDQLLGLNPTTLGSNQVGYVKTAVYVEPATPANGTSTTTFNAILSGLQGGELIVATLQWKGNPPTFTPNLMSAAGSYTWQTDTGALPQKISDIQVFTALNPAHSVQFTVQVKLNSVVPWSLCLSAYNTVDVNAPTYSPQTAQVSASVNNPVTTLQTAQIGLSVGDALYAVSFAANGDGSFPPGANNLGTGPGFTLDNSGNTNPLVEHLITSDTGSGQSLPAVVMNTTGNPTANIFVLGMGIRAEPQS